MQPRINCPYLKITLLALAFSILLSTVLVVADHFASSKGVRLVPMASYIPGIALYLFFKLVIINPSSIPEQHLIYASLYISYFMLAWLLLFIIHKVSKHSFKQ
mgnify:CR=1 FL=1